jgi:hypothetical protein
MFLNVVERFVAFRRIPIKVVAITALASYALQIGAILQGQPLFIIALYTLIPWIPLAFFEGLWKYENYSWMAVFAIITALQVGHLGEHAFQVTQLRFLNGGNTASIACPPPKDTEANARRAVEMGLRQPGVESTGRTASTVNYADPSPSNPNQRGSGPPACGVFGQLDFETIHLVWDTLVWVGALWLLMKFPSNKWLWVSMVAASLHELEHLFLGYIYFFETAKDFNYTATVWATNVDGKKVTATAVGSMRELNTFYEAGGKTGIMGKNGFVERYVLNSTGANFPLRAYLHWWYNSAVVVPTVIAFLVQVRRVYNVHLAKALPELSEPQLVEATTRLQHQKFPAGALIVRQGDPADRFYIITKGSVEVLRQQQNGQEIVVNHLGVNQYFGEIGLLHGGKRIASIRAADDVEVLALDRETFGALLQGSEASREEVERLVRQRVVQVRAAETGAG